MKKDFEYYKNHPCKFAEEFLGIHLTPEQRAMVNMLPLRGDWKDIKMVVRCKNCKHWKRALSDDGSVEYIFFSQCEKDMPGDGNDFYCPYGENKY